MTYYAHSKEDRWQPLKEHLRNVAELASLFAQRCCPSATDFTKTARLTGLLHDLGKYRGAFQKYLQGQQSQGPDTAHAMYGAAAAWHRFQANDMAFVTAGHHSGLHDCGDLDVLVNGTRFQAKQRYPDLLLRLQHEVHCLLRQRHISRQCLRKGLDSPLRTTLSCSSMLFNTCSTMISRPRARRWLCAASTTLST